MSNKKQTTKATPKKVSSQKPIVAEMVKTKKKKTIKIGNFEISSNVFEWVIVVILIAVYIVSPRHYAVTTSLYNSSTEEDQKDVVTALGEENTEERFKLYFQWFNVLHELGHFFTTTTA